MGVIPSRDYTGLSSTGFGALVLKGQILQVSYSLVKNGPVQIRLINSQGAVARTFENAMAPHGVVSREYSLGGLTSGTYLVKLNAGGQRMTTRVVFVQ